MHLITIAAKGILGEFSTTHMKGGKVGCKHTQVWAAAPTNTCESLHPSKGQGNMAAASCFPITVSVFSQCFYPAPVAVAAKPSQGHNSAFMATHWQGCPTAACGLSCKSYQTSKNEVRTIKHFAEGKYVLHLFRKGNGGWSVAIYLCPLRKLLFLSVFPHIGFGGTARQLAWRASSSSLLVSKES